MERLKHSIRHELRAVLGVRARRGAGKASGLRAHRAEPARGPRRLPPGVRQGPAPGGRDPLDPPSSILAGEAFLARIYGLSARPILRWLERLQHDPAHRLGRTGRDLRPCAAGTRPTARSRRRQPASSDSASTAPATGSRRCSSRRGLGKRPCSTRSTGTPR
jgi:hypothetical protein